MTVGPKRLLDIAAMRRWRMVVSLTMVCFLGGCTSLALACVLGGCSSVTRTVKSIAAPVVRAREVEIIASRAANDNSPVAVDVVIAYDPGVADEVASLQAAEWFQQKGQLLSQFPTQLSIVGHLEIVPGQQQSVDLGDITRRKTQGGFVFADYLHPGVHRLRFDKLKHVRIVLQEKDIALQPEPWR